MTCGEWFGHWVAVVAARRVRARTQVSYESVLRLHVLPLIGDTPLRDLGPEDVERLLAATEDKGLSSATVLRAYHVLSRGLVVAVQRGHAERNVARLVDPPTLKPGVTPEPLSVEEAGRVFAAAEGSRNAARWALALAVGLRQSEALALRWSDLDLDRGTLRVDRSAHRVPGQGLVYEDPKSARSRRTVVLAPPVLASLRLHQAAQDVERAVAGSEWEEHGLVFSSRAGRPIDRSGLSSFVFGLGLLLPSVVGGLGLFLFGMGLRLWWRVAAATLFALLTAGAGVLAIDAILGALTGASAALVGIGFLGALSYVLFVVALQAVVGLPGTGLAAVAFIFIGNAVSGGSVPVSFLPDGFRQVAPWLPNNAIVRAARDVVYFHGHDLGRPLLVLVVWTAAALAVLAAVDVLHLAQRRLRPNNAHEIYRTPAVVHVRRGLAARRP